MPNLFTSLGRAALVAIGLTIAASASAQSFSCPTGFNTVVVGAGTPSVQITCQAVASCSTGQVAAVTGAGTNQATVTCETGTPPPDVAPGGSTGSGCSLTANVTSGTAGFGTTLTASCNTGTTPITLNWSTNTGASVANCPTSMAGLSTTCNVSGIAQSGNFTVNFSNSAGNNNKSRSVTVQSGGGGDYAACEKTPAVSTSFYPASNTTTSNIGELNDNSIMVIKFTVPTSAYGSSNSANFSTQYSGDKTRDYVLSTTACDWSGTNAVKYNGNKIVGQTWTNLTFKYSYGNAGSTATLIRGQTYYLSIRGVSGCPSGDCPYGPVTFK